MKLQPELVHEAATELLALWARGEIDPVVGSNVSARGGGRSPRADRVAAARRQGRARAVKALVTGGQGGLGRAMRARLEQEGYEVQSLDLVDGFDVTDPAAWEQVGPVDLACLNAGILTPEIEIAELAADEGYRRAVSVNVDGVVFGVRRLARVMDGGLIVATASLAGLVGMLLDAIYSLTNNAVVGFVCSVALQLAPIRINAICPGIADTPMLDQHDQRQRFAAGGVPALEPDDVAEAIWLAATSDGTGKCAVRPAGREPGALPFRERPRAARGEGERRAGRRSETSAVRQKPLHCTCSSHLVESTRKPRAS